jgi:hypothetical protein
LISLLSAFEAPEIFREFCGPRRPVKDTALWYGVLSDIDGLEDSDLVVNWRGERSCGWGGWADGVDETFRLVCPNNPAARAKAVRQLLELLARYDFAGVFSTRSASHRPRTVWMKCCPALRPLPRRGEGSGS